MAELAFYPAVALIYFLGVLQGTKENRVELPDSASVNVFCLFVLIQPLCLVIGGYTGMAIYLISAIISYKCLHWKSPALSTQKNESMTKNSETKWKIKRGISALSFFLRSWREVQQVQDLVYCVNG